MEFNLITTAETAEYVVAWYAHTNTWVEIARVANGDDARQIAAHFQANLSNLAYINGEEYRAFLVTDFVHTNKGIIAVEFTATE